MMQRRRAAEHQFDVTKSFLYGGTRLRGPKSPAILAVVVPDDKHTEGPPLISIVRNDNGMVIDVISPSQPFWGDR